MTKRLFYLRLVLIIGIFNFVSIYTSKGSNKFTEPKIKVGTSKITGKITNLKISDMEKNTSIQFIVISPLSGEERKYIAQLGDNMTFSIDIPLETSEAVIPFHIKSETKFYASGTIGVSQAIDLQMNIVFDDNGSIIVNSKGGLGFTSDDILNINKAVMLFEEYETGGEYYKMTPREFADYQLNNVLNKRASFALDSLALSVSARKYLIDSFNLRYLWGSLFNYKEVTERSSVGANINNSGTFKAVEPDKSYYSFLRKFDLNSSLYLYSYSYSDFMKSLLNVPSFGIPNINVMPLNKWLNRAKQILKGVVGFDSGLFYDMLAVNGYIIQMTSRKEPLTNKQISEINKYFKGNEDVVGLLFGINKELMSNLEGVNDLNVNETPLVEKEKMMDAILAKYKGKVVVVDFWATYCKPCLESHKRTKSIVKEFKEKDVVFVYITSASSSKELWKGEIKEIGGEQYYLSDGQWNYILDKLSFNMIPTYLFYDKSGELKNKVTGVMDIDKMREIIKVL